MTLGKQSKKNLYSPIFYDFLPWRKHYDFVYYVSASNELVFINFYAQWCRFSNSLAPIFEEAATKIRSAFPEPGRVVMAKVDCEKECE